MFCHSHILKNDLLNLNSGGRYGMILENFFLSIISGIIIFISIVIVFVVCHKVWSCLEEYNGLKWLGASFTLLARLFSPLHGFHEGPGETSSCLGLTPFNCDDVSSELFSSKLNHICK